jgi:hypothetical protein
MKIETYLNAMCTTYYSDSWPANLWDDEVAPDNIMKHRRQYRAFRNRILRMIDEKDEDIEEWIDDYAKLFGELAELEAEFNHYQDQYPE